MYIDVIEEIKFFVLIGELMEYYLRCYEILIMVLKFLLMFVFCLDLELIDRGIIL